MGVFHDSAALSRPTGLLEFAAWKMHPEIFMPLIRTVNSVRVDSMV